MILDEFKFGLYEKALPDSLNRHRGHRIALIQDQFDTGIRIIQLAGFDCCVDEPRTKETWRIFRENLTKSVKYASGKGVVLALENIGPAV